MHSYLQDIMTQMYQEDTDRLQLLITELDGYIFSCRSWNTDAVISLLKQQKSILILCYLFMTNVYGI